MPLPKHFPAQCPQNVFVETGSYAGDGIQAALDLGFKRVISIEAKESIFLHTGERFKDDLRVRMVHGNSAHVMAEAIKDLDEPATFWLDAHWCGEGTGGERPHDDGRVPCPVLDEIDAIRRHPIKGHAILIDDIGGFRHEHFSDASGARISLDRVVEAVKLALPDCTVEFLECHYPEGVLAALP